MSVHDPQSPEGDPFYPPAVPTLVQCMHCGEVYDSYLIQWVVAPDPNGQPSGMWRCPIDDCGGAGFGFDIFPVDADYADERGSFNFEDEGDDEDDFLICDCDDADVELDEDDVDWLQVDGDDCIYSVDQDLEPFEDDQDWRGTADDEDDQADHFGSSGGRKYRKHHGRPRDDDEEAPF